jgi:hypothetical protein
VLAGQCTSSANRALQPVCAAAAIGGRLHRHECGEANRRASTPDPGLDRANAPLHRHTRARSNRRDGPRCRPTRPHHQKIAMGADRSDRTRTRTRPRQRPGRQRGVRHPSLLAGQGRTVLTQDATGNVGGNATGTTRATTLRAHATAPPRPAPVAGRARARALAACARRSSDRQARRRKHRRRRRRQQAPRPSPMPTGRRRPWRPCRPEAWRP